MSDPLQLILTALMEIKQDIGALKQDAESSIRQRAVLFEKTEETSKDLISLTAMFNTHAKKFEDHAEDEAEVFEVVKQHEATLAPFKDAKTKGVAVLAFLALMGGSVGSQAEKLIHVILGK